MDLARKKCVPCEGGVKPFSRKVAKNYAKLVSGWKLNGNKIQREFKFKNFLLAMKFVNNVARIAQKEGHHPDILLYSWNHVRITTYTHAIDGLSENDFILAAKIDGIDK